MNDLVVNQIRAWRIDSFQKLRILLYLHQHPEFCGSVQEYADRLHLADVRLLEKLLDELQGEGLIAPSKNGYRLCNEPGVRSILQHLSRTFEDPQTRQQLLGQVRFFYQPNQV